MGKQSNTLLLFVLYGSAFLAGFNENLMNMGLMAIMGEYAIDSITAQWLVTGYMIVATVMVTAMAFLYRRFKLRPLFFAGTAFTVVGSAMGLFATSFVMLMAARLIQAIGLGLFIPMMMNTILIVVPKNKLGSFMAIGGCMISFGPAFAPVVCGALVSALGWHSIFAVPLFGMLALGMLGILSMRNFENHDAHLDVPSLVLSALFLTALSFGLAQLATSLMMGLGSLAVAAASCAVFAIRQFKIEHPLIDLRPMVRAEFWPATLLVLTAMLITFSLSVLLPLYFEGALGMSAIIAGLLILGPVVVNSVMTLIAGRIMDKRGEWPLLPIGFLLMALGALGIALVAPTMSALGMVAISLVAYIGIGLVFSPSQTAGLKTLPPHENPFGVAIMTTMTQIAACIGPALFVGVMSGTQVQSLTAGAAETTATAEGFSAAILVAAGFAALGFVISLVFSLKAKRRTAAAPARHTAPAAEEILAATELNAIANKAPLTFDAAMPVHAAMRTMVSTGMTGAPVTNAHGRLCGYLSDGDVVRYLALQHPTFTTQYSFVQAANNQTLDERMKELMDLPVSAICTEKAICLDASASFQEACDLLAHHKLEKVPVLDRTGRVVATVSRKDLLHATMKVYLDQKGLSVED